jgi:hypothetical protein
VRFSISSFSSLVLLVSVSLSFPSVLFVQSFYLFASILPSFTYAFHILLYSPYQTCTKYQFLCTSGNNTGLKNFQPMPQMLGMLLPSLHGWTSLHTVVQINNFPLNNQPPVSAIGFPPTPTRVWPHLRTVPFENIEPRSGERLMFYTGKRRFRREERVRQRCERGE